MNISIVTFRKGMEDGTEATGEMFIRSGDNIRRHVAEGDCIIVNNENGIKSICPKSLIIDVLNILTNKD